MIDEQRRDRSPPAGGSLAVESAQLRWIWKRFEKRAIVDEKARFFIERDDDDDVKVSCFLCVINVFFSLAVSTSCTLFYYGVF